MSPNSSTLGTTSHNPTEDKPSLSHEQPTVWLPWTTGSCIATHDQEIAFVDHLRDLGGDSPKPHTRGDITACLNALRAGLTVQGLLGRCPGLEPARLAGAYDDLERRRSDAERSWSIIVASGSISSLVDHGASASALLPSVIGRLTTSARTNPVSFAAAVLRLAESVDKCRRDAYRIEHALARCTPGTSRARQLSSLLYHPFDESIATRDHFLPDRVGMLNPTQVAALLGELEVDAPEFDDLG